MPLLEYKKKRDFSKTREPEPVLKKLNSKNKKLIFVVQKHMASHLHFDLRLEKEGVLKSWAVPKEPPVKVGIKRLAIETEDHPLDYGNFSGIIPKGEYGAGVVEIWDKGNYTFEKFSDKEIIIELFGKKLKGKYILIKTKYGNKPEKSWLLFRSK